MNTDEDPAQGALGALIRQLRLEVGLSMYQLARRSSINRSTLKRIEDGMYHRPSREVLTLLANELDAETEDLYDAMWRDCRDPLPSLPVYFRCKYGLTDEQIRNLDQTVKRLVSGTSDSDAQLN